MPEAAGNINIVLSVNKANYSAAMAEAQRQLDVFAGKAKTAGHSTVSSMQASSAAIRELKNPLGDNTRAIERFITTIPGVGAALKVAFPLVGGAAFATMIADVGVKIADFVKKVRAMPDTIRDGFAALNLSQKTSIDSMNVLTDKLADAHAAFEHKPGNGLKTGIDEAKESADKFAESVVTANSKVNELLSKNHLTGWAILLGKVGTGATDDAFKAYSKKQDHQAYILANAAPGSPEQAAATKAMSDNRNGFIGDRQRDHDSMVNKNYGNQYGAGIAADEGVIATLKNEQAAELAQTNHAAAEGQAAKDEAAKKAAEQAKAAASKQVQAMVAGLNALKLQYNMSVKAEYDYWQARRDAIGKGSDTVKDAIIAKQAELAVAGGRAAHEAITKFGAAQKRDDAEQGPLDPMRAMDAWNKQQASERTQGYLDTNQGFIDSAQNRAKDAEADISERVGKSLTQFDAALQLAKIHTEEYDTTLASLKTIRGIRATNATNDPTAENQRALADALKTIADYQTMRGIQVRKDNLGVNGESTSGAVGAADALEEFVQASRDAATQMRDLVNNTLHGLNAQIITGMMGKRTDFKGVGSDMFKSIGNSALNRAEGGALDMLGLGKGKQLGTASNPMHVIMAGVGSIASGAGKAISSVTGGAAGKLGSVFGGLLKAVLPGFAGGGYMDGPSIVGERGPELFIPGVAGTIIPNNKLTAGSSGDIHFHPGAIDARGATDPAQVDASVQRAIRAAAPHLMAGSVKANRESMMRRPSRA